MLLPVVDRYGAAIEWDLRHEWQVDIHEYFRGERPWRQLIRFLDGLTPTSHYIIAKQNDPVVAIDIAHRIRENKLRGGGGKWSPPAIEWDTHAELLAKVADRLGEAVSILADLPVQTDKHGKPKKRTKPPKQLPRPESAIDRAEQLLSEEHVNEIMADVEAGKVSEEEYARIAAEVEEARKAAGAPVTSPEDQQPGN